MVMAHANFGLTHLFSLRSLFLLHPARGDPPHKALIMYAPNGRTAVSVGIEPFVSFVAHHRFCSGGQSLPSIDRFPLKQGFNSGHHAQQGLMLPMFKRLCKVDQRISRFTRDV